MKIKWILLILLMVTAGCGKKGPAPDNKPAQKPEAPILMTPAQNEVCTSGNILSDSTSAIVFNWGAVNNANTYELHIRNLLDNQVIQRTLSATTVTATLRRNTPYSWRVTTKGSAGDAVSKEWKFYVAGMPFTTYAPYPAELISPLQGESIVTTSVALSWKGSSVSDNIAGYDLYFGTASTPPLLKTNLSPFLPSYSVAIVSGNTYYWRVVTKDVNGNASTSPLFQFNNR
jgi:predicted small lipoprotein YifL